VRMSRESPPPAGTIRVTLSTGAHLVRHHWRRGTIAMSRHPILAVISLLAEKWPSCFSIIESGRRPLKLGIRDDVLAALDGAISAGKVSAALRWYVSSPEYQHRLLLGVGLSKPPAGPPSKARRPPPWNCSVFRARWKARRRTSQNRNAGNPDSIAITWRRAAPDGARKKAGRSSGRQKKAG
jgi:hypothetical protein